jgi:hypothetical protein
MEGASTRFSSRSFPRRRERQRIATLALPECVSTLLGSDPPPADGAARPGGAILFAMRTPLAASLVLAVSGFLAVEARAGEPSTRVEGGILLVAADDELAPGHGRIFNLEGRSILFTPSGETFRSETTAIEYEEELGRELILDRSTRSAPYTIAAFGFPFYGSTVRTLHVSQLFAVYLAAPPPLRPSTFWQYGEDDLLAERTPVIAPFLTTPRGQGSYLAPKVYVRELSDRVVFTWFEPTRAVGVQAVLFSSGDIRFSYRGIGKTRGGSVLITSGGEGWRSAAPLESVSDPERDFGTTATGILASMVDIVRVEIGRLGDTNLLQVAITTRSPVNLTALPPGGVVGAQVLVGDPASGVLLAQAYFSNAAPASGGWLEGSKVVLLIDQNDLGRAGWTGELRINLGNIHGSDTAVLPVSLAAGREVRTDFANVTSAGPFDGPIQDTFTLPDVAEWKVWLRARDDLGLDPTAIDGVAIYQKIVSTSVFQSPFASLGNHGVDNISLHPEQSSAHPREPTVMSLGLIRETSNASDFYAGLLLLHEFGHRWLFHAGHTNVAGKPNDAILTPGGHPIAGLDAPAAFPYVSPLDNSVMGARTYIANANGTFTTAPDTIDVGYSWLDLYLMGLAAPEEVPPFFYLTNTQIDPYDMLPNYTFTATRNDLTIQNVIERMGPRRPAYPNTQRVFKVLFVLVYDPLDPPNSDDVATVGRYAYLLEQRFRQATGGRGSVVTHEPKLRPRTVRR